MEDGENVKLLQYLSWLGIIKEGKWNDDEVNKDKCDEVEEELWEKWEYAISDNKKVGLAYGNAVCFSNQSDSLGTLVTCKTDKFICSTSETLWLNRNPNFNWSIVFFN